VITKYGKCFDAYVTRAISEIENGIQDICGQIGLVKGCIHLAGNWTMMGGFLPEKLRAFSVLYPDVTYKTKFMLTSQTLDSILSGESDLGFCGNFDDQCETYSVIDRTFLYEEDLVLIVPHNHKYASRQYVEFEALADQNFITFKNVNSGGVYEAYTSLCAKYKVAPRVSFEGQDDHVIVALVRAGMGIALVPDSKWLPLDDVAVLRFPHDTPKRNQYVIWRKNAYISPVARTFRDFVIQSIKEKV